MTSSDGPIDPSMDEILASIRKIIADEPVGSRPLPEQRMKTVAALAEARSGNGASGTGDRQGYTRLGDAIRFSGAGQQQRAQAQPVAQSIDDDLADLLDGSPLTAREVPRRAEPSPSPSSSRTGPLDTDWLAKDTLAPKQQPTLDTRGTAPSAAPARAYDRPAGGRDASPSPLGLSALSTASAARAEPSLSSVVPTAAASEPARAFVADSGKPLDIGAIVPGLMNLANAPANPLTPAAPVRAEGRVEPSLPGEAPKPTSGAKPASGEGSTSSAALKSPIIAAAEAAQAIAAKLEPKKPGPEVIAAMPVNTAGAAKPAPAPAARAKIIDAPVLDAQPSLRRSEKDTPAPTPVLDLDTSAAAASALGALAAGLAATRAKADGIVPTAAEPAKADIKADPKDGAKADPEASAEPLPTSVCSVPDFFIHGVMSSKPKSAVTAEPKPAPAAAEADAGLSPLGLRSLEDTVAELLRPMLRQWLADNMPRIVEKALRIEVAEGLRPGAKRPGS